MKKKITIALLGLVCAGSCAVGLAACGGGGGGNNEPNKLKITLAQYSDEGISGIYVYSARQEDYTLDTNSLDNLHQSGTIFINGESCTAEINEGEYVGVIVIDIDEFSHYLGDLKMQIDGTECELLPTSYLEHNPFGYAEYFAVIGEDGKFSTDLAVSITGHTTIKTFSPTIKIENDSYNAADERYNDLKFKFSIIEDYVVEEGQESGTPTPVTINGKTEFTVAEITDPSFELPQATYFDLYTIRAYFADHAKFFPTADCLRMFTESASVDNYEVVWEQGYYESQNGPIKLDFTAFDYNDRPVTLEDMTSVKFTDEYAGNMFNSMFQADNVKYVVDGVEKTSVTLAEYRNATSFKVKSIVSELGEKILKHTAENMYVGCDYDWHGSEDKDAWGKRFTQNEIIIGNEVSEKPGYKEVTFDFGDYKTDYAKLGLRIYAEEESGQGGYTQATCPKEIFSELNKIELVYDKEYDHRGNDLDFYGANENHAIDYDSGNCYYLNGKDLEIMIGVIRFSGTECNRMKLTITKEDDTTEEVTLNYLTRVNEDNSVDYVWRMDAPHESIKLEDIEYFDVSNAEWGTKLTISAAYGKVKKIESTLVNPIDYNVGSGPVAGIEAELVELRLLTSDYSVPTEALLADNQKLVEMTNKLLSDNLGKTAICDADGDTVSGTCNFGSGTFNDLKNSANPFRYSVEGDSITVSRTDDATLSGSAHGDYLELRMEIYDSSTGLSTGFMWQFIFKRTATA